MLNLQKYSWKIKNWILSTGSLILFFLFYQLAIKKTVNLRKAYYEQQNNIEVQQQTFRKINVLRKNIETYSINDLTGTNNVFFEKEYMVELAHKFEIEAKNLSETTTVEEENNFVNYNAYYFSASFTKLLFLLNQIEKNQKINILNASFYKQKNNITRDFELIMKLETARIETINK
ncbi:hypothetical protein [Albibacterium sp.]|uniref:hypothetical protein n=1 Tax=Albibacterium sp. TaxID=2952885 RepID=UPI002BA72ACB|nr:hypothetical protein [Albibacterium sp.]HUH17855.1 hypothetical protein [Albibacterium sp.]